MKKFYLLLLLAHLWSIGSMAQISFSDISVTSTSNTLRFSVSFSTSKACCAFLEYQAEDAPLAYTNVTALGTSHQITLIGLRPNTSYQINLHAFDASGQYAMPIAPLIAGDLPPEIIAEVDSLFVAGGAQGGFVLSNARGGAVPRDQYRIFDRQGNIVWYDYMNLQGPPCIGYNLSRRNSIIQPWGDCQTVLELSLQGDTLQQVSLVDIPGNLQVHHDILLNDENHLVVLAAEARTIDKSSVGGLPNTVVVGDSYVELDSASNLLDYWTVFDHLDAVNSTSLGGFWNPIFGLGAEDWTHANSLTADVDGNYLMSLNALDQIIKINKATGELMWTLGENGDFELLPSWGQFVRQHTCTGLGDNRYLLFDNQGGGGFSRALEFELDTFAQVAEVVFTENVDSSLFTGIVGSAYRLPNGNTLSSFGRAGTIVETDPLNQVVWYRSEGSIFNYRSFYVDDLYPRVDRPSLIRPIRCLSDQAEYLETTLPGGYFSGEGITEAGLFDPSDLSPGTYFLTYRYGPQAFTFEIQLLEALPLPIIMNENGVLSSTTSASLYQWFLDGTPIEGANDATFIPTENGQYQVEVTNSTGCSRISDPINVVITSTITPDQAAITITPNPATDWLFIERKQGTGQGVVTIFNALGQQLEQITLNGISTTTIPISSWKSGTYVVHFIAAGKTSLQKIIVTD
ncbi:MAG: aryl-sulfate sulfotransferase [Bacteroidota bacterium]